MTWTDCSNQSDAWDTENCWTQQRSSKTNKGRLKFEFLLVEMHMLNICGEIIILNALGSLFPGFVMFNEVNYGQILC